MLIIKYNSCSLFEELAKRFVLLFPSDWHGIVSATLLYCILCAYLHIDRPRNKKWKVVLCTTNDRNLKFGNWFCLFVSKMSNKKTDKDSPLFKFRFTNRLVTLLAGPLGLDLLRRDFHLTYRAFIIISLATIYYVCFFYTCYLYQHNILKMLEAICINGLAVPVSAINLFDSTGY